MVMVVITQIKINVCKKETKRTHEYSFSHVKYLKYCSVPEFHI